MELEIAQALARLNMIPSRRNDYGIEFGASSSDGEGNDSEVGTVGRGDTLSDYVNRVKSGMGIGSLPGIRRGKGPRHLLDNGELNLGRLVEVPPNQKDDFPGEPIRILDLRSDSELSQFATITFSVLPVKQEATDPTGYGGPLVGIVEFGNGSGVSVVEVDIRRGTLPYNFSLFDAGGARIDWADAGSPEKIQVSPYAGVSISVPGSSIRAWARNDANLRPYPGTVSNLLNVVKEPMKVMAHVSYGIRPSQFGVTRTIYLMNSGTIPAGLDYLCSAIPPFARSFYISRVLLTGSGFIGTLPGINYTIMGPTGPIRPINGTVAIAAGVDSPVIPLPGGAERINISFPAGSVGNSPVNLALVYNIGV